MGMDWATASIIISIVAGIFAILAKWVMPAIFNKSSIKDFRMLRGEVKGLSEELEHLKDTVHELSTTVNVVNHDFEDLDDKMKTLEKNQKEVTEVLTAIRVTNEGTKTKIDSIERQITPIQDKLDNMYNVILQLVGKKN